MASITLYPYVDGADATIYASDPILWSSARNASSGTVRTNYVQATFSTPTNFIERAFFTFDTTAIPAGAVITSATFSVHITSVSNANSPSYRLYGSTNTPIIVSTDYPLATTTEMSSTYLVSPTTGAYADYPLNVAGLASINLSGYTKFAIREAAYDLANVQPGGSNVLEFKDSSTVGTATDPMLVVNYTVSSGNFFMLMQ